MPLADAAAAEAIANQLADEADAIAIEAGPEVNFVYYGWMERGDVPEDVTHVRIHSSVRRIKDKAFSESWDLRIVILNEELEEIGEEAFSFCIALEEIAIPNNVRVIKEAAFSACLGLKRVILGDGLEEIGVQAFSSCESMEEIVIPPAVRDIHDSAFDSCRNLTRVKYCDEIEEFVSCVAMREWWNRGVGKKSLRTYCFLVRCGIPARLGLVQVQSWQANIYDMLGLIPTIPIMWHPDLETMTLPLNDHLDTINAKLTVYESLREAPAIMGLAIPNNDIVLRVLSFV
jgi:hypothetical protein